MTEYMNLIQQLPKLIVMNEQKSNYLRSPQMQSRKNVSNYKDRRVND